MDDEWGLSVEELDSLEMNAKRRLAERQCSSSLASVPPPRAAFPSSPSSSPATGRALPGSIFSSPAKSSGRPLCAKLFRDRPGRIGVETQYNPILVAALKAVPGHEWDQTRRVWTYPEGKLEDICSAILSLSTIPVSIEAVPPISLPRVHQQGPNSGSIPSQRSFLDPQQIRNTSDLLMSQSSPKKSAVGPSSINNFTAVSPKAKRSLSITVQLYLMNDDLIAARNPYHEKIKEACQSVSGRAWNLEERVWTFPRASLKELVQALERIASPCIVIEAIPPLVISERSHLLDNEFVQYSQPEKEVSSSPAQVAAKNRIDAQDVRSQNEELRDCITGQKAPLKVFVKLMLHCSGSIAAKCEYEPRLVAAVKSITKAEWHARERLWVFPFSSLQEAENKLLNVDDLNVNVEQLEPLVHRALEQCSTMPDLRERYSNIPVELESRLLHFQREGIRFALEHGGRALIADEMGLGKTLQAIAFAACFKDDWPVLVVTPSSLRLHWAAMIIQWLNISPRDILVVMPQCFGSNKEGFDIVQAVGKHPLRLDGCFNIVSYDLVTKFQDELTQSNFKIIIADEAHYLKNAQAKRTLACVPLLQRAKYSILLTGTPALSRPIELFKQLEALQPAIYRSVHEYGKRYCMGGLFGVYQGASNCEELHTLMKSTIMIRRLKKDVLSELPLKRRQQIYLSLDERGLKQMRVLFYELETVKRDLKSCQSVEDAEKLKYSERQLISKIYTETAQVKVPAVQDYLSTIIEADCKFLMFAHHKSMLDGIEQFLMKKKVGYVRIDGSTASSSRQALVTKFQENDHVKAAVLAIRAAGLGLTLTAASTVIFAEMSWTPGDLVQAEDRAHRIGQVSSVNVYYLHAHDTVDDLIWDSVQHKLENVGQVLDGKEDTLHLAAAGRHYSRLPPGQSTMKAFLHPCNSVAEVKDESEGINMKYSMIKKRKFENTSEEKDDVPHT